MPGKRAQQATPLADSPDGRGITYLAFLVIFPYVSFRKLIFLSGTRGFLPAAFLLAVFALLYLIHFRLARLGRYQTLYFFNQLIVVEALGLLPPYEDNWGFLFLLLGMQLRHLPSRRAITAWAAVFTTILVTTMMATLDPLPGLGFSMLIIAVAVFLSFYDFLYVQTESAERESRRLLEELQAAHQKLKDYADRVEELTAVQERDRMIRELHDSVGQMIFSISLATESTRLLLAKDPDRLPAALEHLQELTAGALAQMRTLISQWRPSER